MKMQVTLRTCGTAFVVFVTMWCGWLPAQEPQTAQSVSDSVRDPSRVEETQTQKQDSVADPYAGLAAINGVRHYSGLMWIQSLADTTKLREFGFYVPVVHPQLIYRDRLDTTLVGLDVYWPVTLKWDSLPPYVKALHPAAPLVAP